MASVFRRLIFSVLVVAIMPFGSYAVLSSKLQKSPDHTHASIKSSDDHHDDDHDSKETHSHSYTHSHGPDQPEHTHHEGHDHTMVTSGFAFVVDHASAQIIYNLETDGNANFPESSTYSNLFIASIFRPPIA